MAGDEISSRRTLSERDPFAALLTALAGERVEIAAESRARRRWLGHQASEAATLAGILTDAAEAQTPLSFTLIGGVRVRAEVAAIGADFIAIRQHQTGADQHGAEPWSNWLVPHNSLISVAAAEGDRLPAGHRDPTAYRAGFTDAIALLAGNRLDVLVATAAAEPITAELHSVGVDIVRLRDANRTEVVVPRRSIAWLRF